MLVTTEELDAILDRDDVVVVDVRSKMAFMASGHIPRAVVATWHDFSDPNSAIKGTGRAGRQQRSPGGGLLQPLRQLG